MFYTQFFTPIVKCGLRNAFVGAEGGDSKSCLFLSLDKIQDFRFVYHQLVFWLKITQPKQISQPVDGRILTYGTFYFEKINNQNDNLRPYNILA